MNNKISVFCFILMLGLVAAFPGANAMAQQQDCAPGDANCTPTDDGGEEEEEDDDC